MTFLGKFKIIDNYITACDYNFLLKKVDEAIKDKKMLLISPIASHTLVRAHYDSNLKEILDNFDYLVPDSQWVKRSIWFLYGKRLEDRVYGPDLMLKICQLAEKRSYKLFFYGNKRDVLVKLRQKLNDKFSSLNIVGGEESKFRDLTEEEMRNLVRMIEISGADIVFISLGSPKQEVFSYNLSRYLKNQKILIPVGAAFDFISGVKKQASEWMKKGGLEWFFRLIYEPKRLWKRYLIDGVLFIFLILKRKLEIITK